MAEDAKEMNASALVEAVERFFDDLIGTVIPGLLFLGGWAFLFGRPADFSLNVSSPWFLGSVLIGAYVLGQILSSFGIAVVLPTAVFMGKILGRIKLGFLAPFLESDDDIEKKITKSAVYTAFLQRAVLRFPWLSFADGDKDNLHSWRSIAMSLNTSDQNHVVYRFMFISLLNLGVASASLALLFIWVLVSVAHMLTPPVARQVVQFFHSDIVFSHPRPLDFSVVILLLVVDYLLLVGRYSFFKRSLRVPFSMAIVKLEQSPEIASARESQHTPTVYLAGGFHSGWQNNVTPKLANIKVIDPSKNPFRSEHAYTAWDLEAIRRSDWILAYLEAANPGGYALSLEVGFAKALGKRIIFVDEKSDEHARRGTYLAMVRACADYNPRSLEDAIALLRQLPA